MNFRLEVLLAGSLDGSVTYKPAFPKNEQLVHHQT